MGKTAVAIDLTDSERRELQAWHRGVGQCRVWPNGRGSFCWRRSRENKDIASGSALRPPRENGGGAARSVVWRACWTSTVRARRVRSAMTRSRRSSV
jgi:hypothetical protein